MDMQNRDVDQGKTGGRAEGDWRRFKGRLREKWGGLTAEDLDRAQGRRDQLVGRIQERTGLERNAIERDVDTISRDVGYRFQ